MDLRQLQYFLQIADTGSVREAASRVRVAQSALSRHIRALEDELGVALFDRHARGVSLTPAGSRLRERASDILHRVEETRAEVMAEGKRPIGTAAIGTSPATSRLLYGRLAERFHRDYPGVTLSLVEGAPYILLEGLDTGRLDLAILVNPEPRASLEFQPLVTERVYAIGAPKDRRLAKRRAGIADLADLPLILFPRPSGSRMYFERTAAQAGLSLQLAYEVESQDVLKEFVSRGLGYGLLPYSSVQKELEDGRITATEVSGLALTRMLVRRADHILTPAAAELAQLVRREMKALEKAGSFGRPKA